MRPTKTAQTGDGVVHEIELMGDGPVLPCYTALEGSPDPRDTRRILVVMVDEPVTCLECLAKRI